MRWRVSFPSIQSALKAWWPAWVAGGVQTLSFAPWQAWPLQILALAWLARASLQAMPRAAAGLGWHFGLAWLGSGLWWLYVSLHDYGDIAAPLAVAAVLLLAGFLALYYAGALALAAWLNRRAGGTPLLAGLCWAACWLLAELARASWLSGFPWIASGYAHTVGPLAAWAPWMGVYGITGLAAILAAGLALLVAAVPASRFTSRATLLGLGLAVLALGAMLPSEFTRSTGRIRISALQPDVPQEDKFNQDLWDANLDALSTQIEQARGDLVLSPETVVPLPLYDLSHAQMQRLDAAAQRRPLMLGTFLGNERVGFVNSLVGWGTAGGLSYDYGKHHLLPFGEFVPYGFHWLVEDMHIPMVDQARGQHERPFHVAGQRIRPLICFEDLFGEDFVHSVVGPDAATVLVNVSNLAWFGHLMVQDQHLQFSQMRALEFQRSFVRSTNTGATAALDHHGQVLARLRPDRPGILECEVEGREGSTPYARWLAVLGLWPLWLVALLPLLLQLRRGMYRPRP